MDPDEAWGMCPHDCRRVNSAVKTTAEAVATCPYMDNKAKHGSPAGGSVDQVSPVLPIGPSTPQKVELLREALSKHFGVSDSNVVKASDVIKLAKRLGVLDLTWPDTQSTAHTFAQSLLGLMWTYLTYHPQKSIQEAEDFAFKEFMTCRQRESCAPYHHPGMDNVMENLQPSDRAHAVLCKKKCCE
mgnify:CR=1 FL=1